jgi:hypothetical protein
MPCPLCFIEGPGPRIAFETVKAASDALAKLDGRVDNVEHPWTVRYDQTHLGPRSITAPSPNIMAGITFEGSWPFANAMILRHIRILPGCSGVHTSCVAWFIQGSAEMPR